MSRGVFLVVVCVFASVAVTDMGVVHGAARSPSTADAAPIFSPALNSEQACAGCHQKELALWQQSHHAQAMAVANSTTVLGDFADRRFEHESLAADFYRRDNQFWMRLRHQGQTQEWPVSYTFGVSPLQQYLTVMPNGKTQVLPLAWDSRPEASGGQRWMTLYPEEDLQPADRLHWQQPLQNWNGMCADCHSTGLVRDYDPKTNAFNTSYDHVSLSCSSCHRVTAGHGESDPRDPLHEGATTDSASANEDPANFWHRPAGQPTAHRVAPRAPGAMDKCFACHSLREPLVDGIDPTLPFLDQFMPSFIQQPLYFPDGQIREEVYVYGSFLQSKMFDRGVVCQDCHEPHSQALRVTGDGLCAQCHAPAVYAATKHHLHPVRSTGARCVNCHMPATTYMQVDARRDHSFSVPRPLLSESVGAPNVCTSCHADKSAQWAAQALNKAHPQRKPLSAQAQQVIHSLAGGQLAQPVLDRLLADRRIPAIHRASVLANQVRMIQPGANAGPAANWQPPATAFSSPEPLLTLAAIAGADLLPIPVRVSRLVPLLKHERRAVRVAATEALLGLTLPAAAMGDFQQGFIELTTAYEQVAWRGEGAMRRADALLRQREPLAAEAEWLRSISIEPYFAPAYVNLADSYRRSGALEKERQLYAKALARLPDEGVLYHANALFLVRQQDYAAAGLASQRAVELAPSVVGYATVHVLIMERLGKTRSTLGWLLDVLPQYGNDPSLAQLGYALAQKLPDEQMVGAFKRILLENRKR